MTKICLFTDVLQLKRKFEPKAQRMKTFFLLPVTAVFFVLAVALVLNSSSEEESRGLLSWDSRVFMKENREELFSCMEERRLNVLYQSVPDDMEQELVRDFLAEAADREIQVWMLTGDPSWVLDPSGERMKEEICRATSINAELHEKAQITGILMDCEPYLLEDWEADPVATMGKWQSAMDEAHDFAREKGILFGICIPYYLDTEEFPEGVERLINETCDAVFIMNYYKQNEAENIRTEVECARAAGIPVTVIYELQPPGIHGLVEENTYYHDGLEKVEESFLTIRRTLGAEDLYIALHEYGTLRELLRG